MTSNSNRPDILRLAAAVILGCITGTILFLIVALGIGALNDRMQMNIPITMLVTENVLSAVLLAIFIIGSVAYLCWDVWVTPPTKSEEE
jgi:hypothetical protein